MRFDGVSLEPAEEERGRFLFGTKGEREGEGLGTSAVGRRASSSDWLAAPEDRDWDIQFAHCEM